MSAELLDLIVNDKPFGSFQWLSKEKRPVKNFVWPAEHFLLEDAGIVRRRSKVVWNVSSYVSMSKIIHSTVVTDLFDEQ